VTLYSQVDHKSVSVTLLLLN